MDIYLVYTYTLNIASTLKKKLKKKFIVIPIRFLIINNQIQQFTYTLLTLHLHFYLKMSALSVLVHMGFLAIFVKICFFLFSSAKVDGQLLLSHQEEQHNESGGQLYSMIMFVLFFLAFVFFMPSKKTH